MGVANNFGHTPPEVEKYHGPRHTLKEKMSRQDDARALLQSIYTTAVDLIPDYGAETLTVRLHNMATRMHDGAVQHLCHELNQTETVYPGTNLRMVYILVSP